MHYLIQIPKITLKQFIFFPKKIICLYKFVDESYNFWQKIKKGFLEKNEGMKAGQKLKLQIHLSSFTNESIGKINFQSMILYKIIQVGAIHQNYLEYILLCTILF